MSKERKIDFKEDEYINLDTIEYLFCTLVHNICTNKQTPEFKELVEWTKKKHPELWEGTK